MKLDRRQDLNVLYQVCFLAADWKSKMTALASDWLRHFHFFSAMTEMNSTKLDSSKISTFSTMFVFFETIGKARHSRVNSVHKFLAQGD